VQSGMASVSCLWAQIACFVETLPNADLRLLVLLTCSDLLHQRANRTWGLPVEIIEVMPSEAADLSVYVR
jgi:hypothetical protein